MANDRPWAVITGASAGLGTDFALQLAERGWNLVLTARRRDRLESLAERLRAAHHGEVVVIDGDLGDGSFRERLVAGATDGRNVQMIINNAGFGYQGEFLGRPFGDWAAIVSVNILALTDLSYQFGRHMRDHGKPSHLVNVASTGAFQPVPTFAVYAASKSYVRDFSEAISFELGAGNVAVTCVCPGATATEFFTASGMKLNKLARNSLMSSEDCVREALNAALGRRRLVVTGLLNKLVAFSTRFAPRWLAAKIAALAMQPPA